MDTSAIRFTMRGALDPVTRLVRWYNEEREHMSLKDGMETPAEAYLRKMPTGEEKTMLKDEIENDQV